MVFRGFHGGTAKEIRVDPFSFAVDLLGGGSQLPEQELGHGQGHLALAGEDDIGTRVAECRQLAEIVGTSDDEDRRVELACQADRFGASVHVCAAQHEADRVSGAGLLQSFAMSGVTVNGPNSFDAKLSYSLEVQLDHNRFDPVFDEQTSQGLAHRAVADDDRSVALGFVLAARRVLAPRIVESSARQAS